MKGKLYLVLISALVVGFMIVKKLTLPMQKILPEQVIFFIEPSCSSALETQLKNSIDGRYKQSKDLSSIINSVSQEFPALNSVKVHICNTDKICFSLDMKKPLFILGKDLVICDDKVTVPLTDFKSDIIEPLPRIGIDPTACCDAGTIESMVSFFNNLPSFVISHFDVYWQSPDEIRINNRNSPHVTYLISAASGVSMYQIEKCLEIQEGGNAKASGAGIEKRHGSKPVKRKNVTYDLRFKNQIIVR